ncbi:ran GTPase-activating protein 1-like [Ornithodoros turicata]|uniref:ran GTPase-activating protein 1-like n=1 Tax=Ornithodoros turicata TaxID=34597 RepID=UPI0031390078
MSKNGTLLTEVTKQLSSAHIKDARELSFAGQHQKLNTEKEAYAFVAAIKEAGADLECLCLEGNTLGQDAAKAIGKALEGCPRLKRALWKDLFTGRSKAEIPDALRFLTGGILLSQAQLVELDLSDNAFGPIGAEALLVFLGSKASWSLEILKLNNNGLGPAGSQMLFGALGKSVKESRKDPSQSGMPLKVLVCGRNRLENVGATALGDLLKELGTLEEIRLPQNGIFKEGIEALAKGLEHNKRLRLLDLNDNILTPAGAKSVARALRNFEELEELNLGDCLLKTKGAQAIAKVLKEGHTKLKNVYLGHNEVSRSGGLAIVEALSNKESLDVLELDGNRFGSQGIAELEAAMEAAGKIDKLCAFSDDEGTSEDEADEDEEEEEHEEAGDVSEGSSAPVEASEFLAAPTASKLKQMGANRAQKLVEHVQKENSGAEEAYLEAFFKLSSVLGSEEAEGVREMAHSCADALLGAAFEKAADGGHLATLVNTLLVRLGLMKDECHKSKKESTPSPTGALLLLSDVVKQKYFAPLARDALVLLLSKPNPRLEAPRERRACSNLLRVLYQA